MYPESAELIHGASLIEAIVSHCPKTFARSFVVNIWRAKETLILRPKTTRINSINGQIPDILLVNCQVDDLHI